MKYLYWIYQLLIAAPILLIATILCAVTVILFSPICPAWVGYYPPMIWSRLMCWVCLLPVRVEGREHLSKHQSYVFVCNHQGAYDIFLVYGFLERNFRWMMKKSLRNIPLIGKACERAGHVMVDKSGPKAINATCEQGRKVLRGGISLVVFPEGARTFTGHMGKFRRGAFQMAHQLQLPVVPVTIDGSFDVLSRQKGVSFVTWHPLRLVIHEPILPNPEDENEIKDVLEQSYQAIMSSLPQKYQGFVENPDQ